MHTSKHGRQLLQRVSLISDMATSRDTITGGVRELADYAKIMSRRLVINTW